jgi:SH3-like domain-containing protein
MRILFFFLVLVFFGKAFAFCVNTQKANLRKGPGPKYPISWVVPKFTPLLEVNRKGSWIEVQDQDGEKHWVYSQNVTKNISCLSIRVASANLRTGPGAAHPLADIKKVDRYTPFKRIDVADNGWYQVEAPWGGRYWLSGGLVWRPLKIRGLSY